MIENSQTTIISFRAVDLTCPVGFNLNYVKSYLGEQNAITIRRRVESDMCFLIAENRSVLTRNFGRRFKSSLGGPEEGR